MYYDCPHCDGRGTLYAYTILDDSSSGEYFSCPTCSGARTTDLEAIKRWLMAISDDKLLDMHPDTKYHEDIQKAIWSELDSRDLLEDD